MLPLLPVRSDPAHRPAPLRLEAGSLMFCPCVNLFAPEMLFSLWGDAWSRLDLMLPLMPRHWPKRGLTEQQKEPIQLGIRRREWGFTEIGRPPSGALSVPDLEQLVKRQAHVEVPLQWVPNNLENIKPIVP